MKGNVWTVVVIALALAFLVPVINVGYANATEQRVANESTTVDYSSNYTLGQQAVDSYGELTVRANAAELTNGTDYVFHPNNGNGTIDWQDTAATSDGDPATLNYTYQVHDQGTEDQRQILATIGPWIGTLLLVAVAGTIVRFLGGGF